MAIDVFPSNQANRDESPTNPKFADSSISNGDLMGVIIQTSPIGNPIFTIGSELSNQANTKGFRIKHDTDGSNLLTLSSFGTVDYFVLIHSDDPAKHHFAKITNLIVEDNGNGTTTGDAFEFEPKMGNEIPKETKYRVITGVNNNTHNNSIVALSIGLKQDSYNLKNDIVCARPHFYFYNNRELGSYANGGNGNPPVAGECSHGKIDKENELNHNYKYMATINSRTGNGTIEMGQNIPNLQVTGTTGITFRTQQDFGKRIVDYSKFGLKVTMTDVLRNIDEDGFGTTSAGSTLLNYTYNQSQNDTITTDYTDYAKAYPSAKRILGNFLGFSSANPNLFNMGEIRYLHYDTSPQSANIVTGVSQHETEDSIEQGSFSETRIIDNARIMRKKIEEHTLYQTKQLVHIGNLNDFVDLKATYSSTSTTNVFVFDTEYNLQTVLEVGEEIRLGTTIMLVEAVSGTNITVRAEKREAGKNTFTSVSFTPTVGDTLQRRALDYTNQKIFTTMDLSGGVDRLEIVFTSGNLRNLFGEVTAKNIAQSTLTFNGLLENNKFKSYYRLEAVKFAKGEYRVFSTRFTGEVEEINQIKEEGQTYLDIKGRDSMNKLLSPVVNKNALFSEDIVYSSLSPYNKLTAVVGNGGSAPNSTNCFATEIQLGVTQGNLTSVPVQGDLLFTASGFIGRVTSSSLTVYNNSNHVKVSITNSLVRIVAGETIYKQTEKNYMFTKALGSSHISPSATSLIGTANKGIIFTAGNMNSGLDFNGAEGDSLVDTSSFGSFDLNTGKYSSADKRAVGYQIHEPSSIANDNAFQCKLKDEIGSSGESAFDTVDSLIDFEVVSTTKKDNVTEIELAPYMPLSLGRKITYEGLVNDRIETTYLTAATVTAHSSSNRTASFLTNSLSANVNIGDPLYADNFDGTTDTKAFIGYVLDIYIRQTSANLYASGTPSTNTDIIMVSLDRTETNSGTQLHFTTGDTIYYSTRKRSHINLINSAHLWGGKMITIPHHRINSSPVGRGLVPFNMHLNTTDIATIFGMPIYKTFNSDTRRIAHESFNFIETVNNNDNVLQQLYGNRESNFTKNFTCYQFKPNVNSGLDNVIEENKTDTNRKIPYDMRGLTSPFGSNITSLTRNNRNFPAAINLHNSRISKSSTTYIYNSKDYSFTRLFLYITCDILPYYSLRSGSILSPFKEVNNYNLFLTDGTTKTQNDNVIVKDSNFQTLSFSTNQELHSLKRCNLMRLTECVYDENFILINPEKDVNEVYPNPPNSFVEAFFAKDAIILPNITGINGQSNPPTVTFASNVTVSDTDQIWTAQNKFIGKVDGNQSNTSTVNIVRNAADDVYTPSFSVTHANPVLVKGIYGSNIRGRDGKDSIDADGDAGYHPLKGAIVPYNQNYDYGQETDDYARGKNGGTAIIHNNHTELVLPTIFPQKMFTSQFYTIDHNGAFTIPRAQNLFRAGNPDLGNNSFGGTIGVVLDRYGIEDSFHKLEAGNCTGVLGDSTTTNNAGGTHIDGVEIVKIASLRHFKQFFRTTDTAFHNYRTADDRSPADGAYLGFKLRLFYDSNESGQGNSNTHKSSGGDIYKTVFTPTHSEKTAWLSFVDLTGCYLVPESGSSTVNSVDSIIGVKTTPIYVYAHEVNEASADVEIYTEAELIDDTAYRVMQPNPVCFYETSPDNIELLVPRAEYTKKANSNEMYGKQKDNYFFTEGGRQYETTNEAVLSMYVALDADKYGSGNLVSTVNPLGEGDLDLFFSDGENSFKSNTKCTKIGSADALVISNKKKLNGVISVSQTFIVNSLEELKIEPTRACIGSTVTIANETESLINEIFEEEGIEFTNSTITYPLFVAPEFRGVSAFTAINFLLKRKDLRLLETEGVFSVVPHSSSSLVTNILIDDDKLIEFESTKTTFDFYNEVIVYGAAHKGTKRNLNSIKKIGRKTLEEVDGSLLTQQEVDRQASKLLDIHGNLNIKHKIKVIPTGVEQVKAGDIIQFESKQENIGLSNFLVLNVNHELFGFVTLEIGRYSKRLEDVFSELLLKTQNNANKNRSQDYISKTPSLDFLEKIKVKPISLTIRKRATTGTTLGFTTTLNTNTTPLGIGGSSTATLLKEEDLI